MQLEHEEILEKSERNSKKLCQKFLRDEKKYERSLRKRKQV